MYNNIPNELKNIPNWVCWKAYPDANSHSGIKKVPINPHTGGRLCPTIRESSIIN